MKLLFCYIEYLDSLRLGHAKRLMSWVGLYGFQTTETPREILQDSHHLILVDTPCPWNSKRKWCIQICAGSQSKTYRCLQGAVSFWRDCTRLLRLLNYYQTIWSLPRRRHNRVTKAAWMNTLNIIKFFVFRDMKKSLKVSLTYSNTKHVLILLQRYLYIWEWKRFTFFFVEVKSIYWWWVLERKVSEGWH